MNHKEVDLGKGHIGKLLVSLALPAIIAQLVNLLYNVIDRIFIGRMPNGDLAMAGVGVAMPIIMLIAAFSALIGSGGAPLVAIKMGEKDQEGAEKIMSNSFSVLLVISAVLTFLFYLFKKPMLLAFGGSEATIGYALDYFGVYLLGTLFVQIALGMNSFITTQGFAKIGMLSVTIGAVVNIILDPIFIFGLNMGVKGAALASVLGQLCSAIWVLNFLFGKKSSLKIRRKYLKPKAKIVLPVIALGVAPFIMQSTESLVLISLNNQLSKYGGDLAVGAMAIMSSIMQIIILPLFGLCQGAQPIISYNYGAKNLKRVKQTFRLLMMICLGFTFGMVSLIMIFPESFVKLFNHDVNLVSTTAWSMKIYFAGMFIFGAQIACQQTFLALGQAKMTLIMALLRKIVLLVPLIFILPAILSQDLRAVLLAEPIADVLAATITTTCFLRFYKEKLRDGSESL